MTEQINDFAMDRRRFVQNAGALVVAISFSGALGKAGTAGAATLGAGFPVVDPALDQVDSFLTVAADNTATVYSGIVELGTGNQTAVLQMVAEELDMPFDRMNIISGITGLTPNQNTTSGSRAIPSNAQVIKRAAAQARQYLLEVAAKRFGVPVANLRVADGVVTVAGDASKRVTYGELVAGQRFNIRFRSTAPVKNVADYKIVGTSVKRIDIPAKVTGEFEYLHDIRVPGMLHARVVRPPSHGAKLVSINGFPKRIPGLVKVVAKGDFVAVVCEREEQAVRAAKELRVKWTDWADLPTNAGLAARMRATPDKVQADRAASSGVNFDVGKVDAELARAAKTINATYFTPYHMHGSFGPSCAVADYKDGELTVWTGTQSVFGMRVSISQVLGIPESRVKLIYGQASGCYGQSGADDAAVDAALLAVEIGRPVRVQWMRHDEHGWEPYAPARLTDFRGGVDADGNLIAWDEEYWMQTAFGRSYQSSAPTPVYGGRTITAQLAGMAPGADFKHNASAAPSYGSTRRSRLHYLGHNTHRDGPIRIRTGSRRGVGATMAYFAGESFIDELAALAGADPLVYRQRYSAQEPRAVEALEKVKEISRWETRPSPKKQPATANIVTGRGAALMISQSAYVGQVVEVEVNKKTGKVRVKKIWIAHDCGLIINPDGVRNQVEGGMLQALSMALFEEVKFNRQRVTSLDWDSYPVLRSPDVPELLDIHLINRPDEPPSGAGEPCMQSFAAAIGNAIFDATGVRIREQPFSPARVKAALAKAAKTAA
jgi:nicotinate dehydrogenase subunit B